MCMSPIWNMGVSASQGLIRMCLYGHAFGTLHFCPDNCNVQISERPVQGFHCNPLLSLYAFSA